LPSLTTVIYGGECGPDGDGSGAGTQERPAIEHVSVLIAIGSVTLNLSELVTCWKSSPPNFWDF
jgi:hypothetical protein